MLSFSTIQNAFGTEKPVVAAAFMALLLPVVYLACTCIYNLYFHPLRKFPGPKIAALGPYYEFYHDVIKDGTFTWRVLDMHLKYGPIVRINANELHVYDSEFYSQIYASSSRRTDKYLPAVEAYTFPNSTIATIDHDLHRKRRAILSPYFSKRSISALEPAINERVSRLCGRIQELSVTGETVDLDAASAAMTADIISGYFYGEKSDYLGRENFQFTIRDVIIGLIGLYHVTRFFPRIAAFMKSLPYPLIRVMNAGVADFLSMQDGIKRDMKATFGKREKTKSASVMIGALEDPSIPAVEKTIERLVDEGSTIIFAGTETTSRSISVTMFHLLNNKALLQRLREELQTITRTEDGLYSLPELESLPFLSGCIQEGVRLSHGPAARLPRVATHDELHYGHWVIPRGTPISQSTVLVNLDARVFPNPHSFDPDRWIRAKENGVVLSKYLGSFNKGSRVCIGINMAYAELYITIARLASAFDMDLFETTMEDMEMYHIRLTGYPRNRTGEVKVKVTKCLA